VVASDASQTDGGGKRGERMYTGPSPTSIGPYKPVDPEARTVPKAESLSLFKGSKGKRGVLVLDMDMSEIGETLSCNS